jgi:hypothetical protein
MGIITIVVGAPGVGKTHWIRERLADISPRTLVSYIGIENPIDAASLAAEFPDISVSQISVSQISVGQVSGSQVSGSQEGLTVALAQWTEAAQSNRLTYLEINDPTDLAVLEPQLTGLPCWRVLVQSDGKQDAVLTASWGGLAPDWADAIWDGRHLTPGAQGNNRWRSAFTEAVFDPASLDTAWQELTAGAYGPVQRAKGLFELVDGRLFQIDFVVGGPSSYSEVKRSGFTHPADRVSRIDVIADSLNWDIITDTIRHCQLSEAAIAYYQDQYKLLLGETVAP